MIKIFDADLVKGHFIVTDNGKRVLVDTGCPVNINEKNMQRIPGLRQHLEVARGFVDPTLDEFWGLEYFARHKVLFDYRKKAVMVADQGDDIMVVHPIAEYPLLRSIVNPRLIIPMKIAGVERKMVFDSGACIANYITESIATTGTEAGSVFDEHPDPDIGRYEVKLFNLPVEIGGEKVDIPFGSQPKKVDHHVQADGAIGVIGIGLYEKFQVLVDCPNQRIVLGKY